MIYKTVELTFHDAKECAPRKTGDYLCYMGTYYTTLKWEAELNGWNVHVEEDGSRKNELFPESWAKQPALEVVDRV